MLEALEARMVKTEAESAEAAYFDDDDDGDDDDDDDDANC